MTFYLRILSFYLRDFRVLFGLLLEFTIKGVYSILKILFSTIRSWATVDVMWTGGFCGNLWTGSLGQGPASPKIILFSSVFGIIKEMKRDF